MQMGKRQNCPLWHKNLKVLWRSISPELEMRPLDQLVERLCYTCAHISVHSSAFQLNFPVVFLSFSLLLKLSCWQLVFDTLRAFVCVLSNELVCFLLLFFPPLTLRNPQWGCIKFELAFLNHPLPLTCRASLKTEMRWWITRRQQIESSSLLSPLFSFSFLENFLLHKLK